MQLWRHGPWVRAPGGLALMTWGKWKRAAAFSLCGGMLVRVIGLTNCRTFLSTTTSTPPNHPPPLTTRPTPHHPSHPTPPLLLSLSAADSGLPDGATLVRFPSLFTSDQAELRLKIQLPPGYHLTKGANSGFQAAVVGGEAAAAAVEVSPARGMLQEGGGGAVLATLAVRRRAGGALAPGAVLRVLSKVYFCQQDDACLFEEVVFEVPLAERAQQQPGFKEERQLLEMSHSVSASAPQVTLPGL